MNAHAASGIIQSETVLLSQDKTKMIKRNKQYFINRTAVIFLTSLIIFTVAPFLCGGAVHAASVTASGRISEDNVKLRENPKASSKTLGTLEKGTEVLIKEEVFTSSTRVTSAYRWYKIKAGKQTGFVRAKQVRGIEYGSERGVTVCDLDYLNGPGTSFSVRGTISGGSEVQLMLPARKDSSSKKWYKTRINGKTAYLSKTYVARTCAPEPSPEVSLKGRPKVARALLSNPTKGGKARYVYTFGSKNCTKLFAVTGYSGVTTPQGLAYTGKRYYVLYGNKAGQRIVTYSSKGKRLRATRFAFAIGHPNGMTWDPETGLCYIFKGHQKRIYTWDPKTNKFGKSKTPYNASGGAYDSSTGMIYASSKPCMYTYGSDGKFKIDAAFGRCSHSFQHSAQDCGAGGGFLFHAVSGSDYRNTNYLDVYRISDRKYLGSIKVTLGEVESAVVNKDGYVELLINHSGTTDYVWRTPLNINDLQ